MRPGDRRTKTMDRDPNTESKAQRLAELPSCMRHSGPSGIMPSLIDEDVLASRAQASVLCTDCVLMARWSTRRARNSASGGLDGMPGTGYLPRPNHHTPK